MIVEHLMTLKFQSLMRSLNFTICSYAKTKSSHSTNICTLWRLTDSFRKDSINVIATIRIYDTLKTCLLHKKSSLEVTEYRLQTSPEMFQFLKTNSCGRSSLFVKTDTSWRLLGGYLKSCNTSLCKGPFTYCVNGINATYTMHYV